VIAEWLRTRAVTGIHAATASCNRSVIASGCSCGRVAGSREPTLPFQGEAYRPREPAATSHLVMRASQKRHPAFAISSEISLVLSNLALQLPSAVARLRLPLAFAAERRYVSHSPDSSIRDRQHPAKLSTRGWPGQTEPGTRGRSVSAVGSNTTG
jgi:hypothetical protein